MTGASAARRSLILVAALASCGGAERQQPERPSQATAAGDAIDLDFRMVEAIYLSDVRPVERRMCRARVPVDRCQDACAGARDVREISARICGAPDPNPAQERRCAESRSLVRRADTTCAFCRGTLTRRPCADVF